MQASYATNNESNNELLDTSYLAQVDVRAKMLLTLFASIVTIVLSGFYPQSFLFVLSFFYALSMKKHKILITAYIFIVVISLISLVCVLLLEEFLGRSISDGSLLTLFIPFLRMATMMNVVLPLAFSSSIQSLLIALKSLHLPFCIYLPAAVMVRFIPTFINDIKQVAETLKMRGFRLSFITCTLHPILSTRFLFTPILFRSLRTSEELGIAAELKGLGYSKKMSAYKKLHWKKTDSYFIFIALFIALSAVLLEIYIGVPVSKGGMR